MHDHQLFDDWAARYDDSVSRNTSRYPFENYYGVLGAVANALALNPGDKVVDLGIGTGLLARWFADRGCSIIGVDFSVEMLSAARQRLPQAVLMQHDFRQPLPAELYRHKPTHAVATYSLHHLDHLGKISLIEQLLTGVLEAGGTFAIGDVGFSDRSELEQVRAAVGPYWDGDEDYLVANELVPALAERGISAEFSKLGDCAAVLVCRRGVEAKGNV